MKCIVCQADPARYRCRHCKSAYCSSNCFKAHRAWNTAHDESVAAGTTVEALPAPSPVTCEFIHRQENSTREEERDQDTNSAPGVSSSSLPRLPKQEGESADGGDGHADVFSDVAHDEIKQRRRESQAHVHATPGPSAAQDAVDTHDAHRRGGDAEGHGDDQDEDEDGLTILRERHLRALANHPRLRNALKTRELQMMIRTVDSSRSRLDALETAMFNHPEFADFCQVVKATIASAEHRDS